LIGGRTKRVEREGIGGERELEDDLQHFSPWSSTSKAFHFNYAARLSGIDRKKQIFGCFFVIKKIAKPRKVREQDEDFS
jgi:hypothetical protein